MKLIAHISLAVATAAFAIGCAGGRSIQGKWNAESGAELPAGSSVTAEFTGADKLTMNMSIPQALPTGSTMTVNMVVAGTYKIEGETMQMKADDVKVTATGIPDAMKPQIESSLSGMGSSVKEQINKDSKTKFAWVDDNTFTLTGENGKATKFTRAK